MPRSFISAVSEVVRRRANSAMYSIYFACVSSTWSVRGNNSLCSSGWKILYYIQLFCQVYIKEGTRSTL
jgi:hypothetical protein